MSLEARGETIPYSGEWFKKRAIDSLRPIEQGSWDYSDSLLIYLPGADEEYETIQEQDMPYNRLVTIPERAYLSGIAPELVSALPREFEYIDLGPGTEHKEQFVFDAAREQGKKFVYRPVDISEKYLRMSSEYATSQGISTQPLRSSFEELGARLGVPAAPRYVSLGLTYSNYEPRHILELLRDIAGEEGSVFINAQLRERTDMAALQSVYAGVIPGLVSEKLRLLGIDDAAVDDFEVTDEIKAWRRVRAISPVLERKGVVPGDRLLVLQSLRPTLESLQDSLSGVFPRAQLFDTGSPFVGALLSTK